MAEKPTKSKMAAIATLTFNDLPMANIYPHTKFDATIFIGDRDMT